MRLYRAASNAPHPIDVEALGRTVPPGEDFATAEPLSSPHDVAMIDEGMLLDFGESADAQSRYADVPMERLAEIAAEAGVEVEGTGKQGRVTKDDYVAALDAHDAEKGA